MRRAQKRHGSDIVKIVKNYKSRTFGFASRNFYAEFLAALHVVKNQNKYFPNLSIKKPLHRVSIKLPNYIHINTAMYLVKFLVDKGYKKSKTLIFE